MLLPAATEFDVENNTLYAETDELGTYCVLDMEVLLQNFGVAPDGTQMETVMAEYYSAAEASEASLLTVSDETSEATDSSDASNGAEKYYVTFVFDIRDGRINEGQLDNLKAEMREFSETVYAEGRDIVIRLMTQDSSDFDGKSYALMGECDNIEKLDEAMDSIEVSEKQGVLGNYCVITDALGYVVEHADSNNSNYVFTVYDQADTMFEQNIADELILNAVANDVDISVITPAFEELTGFQKYIADDSHGVVIDSFSDFADDVYVHIFNAEMPKDDEPDNNEEEDDEKEDVSFDSFGAILITGYEWVELNGPLNSENKIDTDFTECDEDDDDFHINDHLTDWQEVGVDYWIGKGLITYDIDGNIKLPTIQECMDFTKLSYVEDGLARFQEDTTYRYGEAICTMRVMPILSDPTRADSDGDGITDGYDPHKLLGIDEVSPCLYDNSIEGAENHILMMDEIGDSYICVNCDMEPLAAPEAEDRENLSDDDYMTVQVLLSIYRYFIQIQDYLSADATYASIEKIRYYKTLTGKKYSCSNIHGDYYSPIPFNYIDTENNFYITVDVLDTTYHNEYVYNVMTATKFVGDILFLCSPAKIPAWVMTAGAISFSILTEIYFSHHEGVEWIRLENLDDLAISIAATLIDTKLTDSSSIDELGRNTKLGASPISTILYCVSSVNKFAIAKSTNSHIDTSGAVYWKDYCAKVTIKGDMGKKTFSYSAKKVDLNSDFELQVYKTNEIPSEGFYNTNYSVILFEEEEWTAINYPYKNAIELFQSDLHYEKKDYARIFSLIGGYYSKMNTNTNIFYWQKFNERTGELYEDG